MGRGRYAVETNYIALKVLAATFLVAAVSFFSASNAAADAGYTTEADGIEATFKGSPKMGEVYSCMSSIDLPADCVHTFRITVKRGTKTLNTGLDGGVR